MSVDPRPQQVLRPQPRSAAAVLVFHGARYFWPGGAHAIRRVVGDRHGRRLGETVCACAALAGHLSPLSRAWIWRRHRGCRSYDSWVSWPPISPDGRLLRLARPCLTGRRSSVLFIKASSRFSRRFSASPANSSVRLGLSNSRSRARIPWFSFPRSRPGEMAALFPGKPMTSVFLPCSPNPTTGFYFYVPTDEIVELPYTPEEAVKLVMSAGMILPQVSPEAAARLRRRTVRAFLAFPAEVVLRNSEAGRANRRNQNDFATPACLAKFLRRDPCLRRLSTFPTSNAEWPAPKRRTSMN